MAASSAQRRLLSLRFCAFKERWSAFLLRRLDHLLMSVGAYSL